MAKRNLTLPRHTIIAPQGKRFIAAIIDFAFMFALFIPLFFASNAVVTNTKTNAMRSQLSTYELYSDLVYFDSESQTLSIYNSSDDYTVYQTPVLYFYTQYLTGHGETDETRTNVDYLNAPNSDEPVTLSDGSQVSKAEYYNIPWFNEHVLGITEDDPDAELSQLYFTYARDADNNYNKDVLGVPKATRYDTSSLKTVEITSSDLAKYVGLAYQDAYYLLTDQPFYNSIATVANYWSGLSVFFALLPAALIMYMVVPLISKKGATFAKMILGLGLANMQGYRFKKYQLLLRFIPFLLTSACVFFIAWDSIYISLIIPAVILLVSWGITLASPKRCALHDYCAQTIVIDAKASTIYDTFLEEEAAIEMEEGLPSEPVAGGEEPDISYEK